MSHEHCASAIDLLHKTGLDKTSLGCDLVVGSMPSNPQDLRLVMADSGWLVLLVAIIPQADVTMVLERLRLSRADQKFCEQLAAVKSGANFCRFVSALTGGNLLFLWMGVRPPIMPVRHGALVRILDRQHYRILHQWHPPKLPVSGADLLSHGVDKGQAFGQMLKNAETLWVQSDFTMTKSALLAAVVK